MTRTFILNYNGVDYDCNCYIGGKEVLYQEIHVLGYWSERDPKFYGLGDGYRHPSHMEPNAKIIARRIIEEAVSDSTP
jgi:hypothetical protein